MLRSRRLAHRLVAGLLALWFAVVATEGARVHACAMHDAAPEAAHGSQAAHGQHASHGAPADQGSGHHQCSCPDTSCGSAIVALASPRLTTHFGIAVADVRAVFAPATTRHPVAVPYLTPFANGPPAGALA